MEQASKSFSRHEPFCCWYAHTPLRNVGHFFPTFPSFHGWIDEATPKAYSKEKAESWAIFLHDRVVKTPKI